MLKFTKLINRNPVMENIIGGMICEYDIRSAGATAIRQLKGEDVYNTVMKLPKKERNIYIGKMMRGEKGLSHKVNQCMLDYMNKFLEENGITSKNFIYSTRDSILLYNKIPVKVKFKPNVVFRNKDGQFSSMYTIDNKVILFDSMLSTITIKGIDDEIVKKSEFVNSYLVNLLDQIETTQKSGNMNSLLKRARNNYLNSKNLNIYKSLNDEDRLPVMLDDNVVLLDMNANDKKSEIDINDICKDYNYNAYVLPILRTAFLNG